MSHKSDGQRPNLAAAGSSVGISVAADVVVELHIMATAQTLALERGQEKQQQRCVSCLTLESHLRSACELAEMAAAASDCQCTAQSRLSRRTKQGPALPYLGVAVLVVVGRGVGIRVGVAVGDREGTLNGAAVGSCEGSPLCVKDGIVVREAAVVGAAVLATAVLGGAVGRSVGSCIGVLVGIAVVGEAVGEAVGESVGCKVGCMPGDKLGTAV